MGEQYGPRPYDGRVICGHCPKCDAVDPTVEYIEADTLGDSDIELSEHLEVTCRRCGFIRTMRCKDDLRVAAVPSDG